MSTEVSRAITKEFEGQAINFKEHGWAYIPNFFSAEIHRLIISAWPPLQYFTVGSDPTKSYDRGPRWSDREIGKYTEGICPDFFLGFEALINENFLTRVNEFCGDGINRVNTSLASAWARNGSLLLPHIDDVWQFGRGAVINFVIFIDGSTPVESSGATAIYATNSYENPIFIPTSLINSALVYETGRFIYHGFPRVGRGKFSKRLIAQYSPEFQPKLSELMSSNGQTLLPRSNRTT